MIGVTRIPSGKHCRFFLKMTGFFVNRPAEQYSFSQKLVISQRLRGIFRKEKLRHRNLVTPAAQRYEKMDNPNLLYYR